MAVTFRTAHWRQWQGCMIVGLLDVLLATAGHAANFNHDGDFDGDGKMDPAVYNEPTGEWHIMFSDGNYEPQSFFLGGPGWTAIQSDYDGDQRADVALYNRATGLWNILLSGTGYRTTASFTFGGDDKWVVVTGDYDGDGKTDPTIYCEATGEWLSLISGKEYIQASEKLGGPGMLAVSGDYDGDRVSDPAIYRQSDGLWLIGFSSQSYAPHTFYVDTKGDGPLVPSPADYDGDRKTDPAVFAYSAPSWEGKQHVFAWHLLSSAQNFRQIASFYQLGREDGKRSNADPAPGDYDGDGKADFGVSWPDYESAHVMWRMWKSSNDYVGHDDVNQWDGDDNHPVQR